MREAYLCGMKMKEKELKEFLDEKAELYNSSQFIETDPIRVPHRYSAKEDIEIAGFLTATIAWGNRKSIIANAEKLLALMDDAPHQFILGHEEKDLERFSAFVHRTFQFPDTLFFLSALKEIYLKEGGLEQAFCQDATSAYQAIQNFRERFLAYPHEQRSEKHVSNPAKGSSAKRLNMFLRWMVRRDDKGVDFGIWRGLEPSQLSMPLDVHSGNVARSLRLLKRKQNDRKAVEELDARLRKFDPIDPVKYDYALFGLGVFEKYA